MPHALTEREKEYLQFLRDFISANESSPQLKDVAQSFGVKLPSAHKVLDALQRKGYLIFRRGAESGYYIRLSEQGGGIEKAIEILEAGRARQSPAAGPRGLVVGPRVPRPGRRGRNGV